MLQTILFDAQGGSAIGERYQVIGQTVGLPKPPTLTGYSFDGWYPTPACDTTKVAFPYTVAGDATLYAKWNEVRVTSVTLDSTTKTVEDGDASTHDRFGRDTEAAVKAFQKAKGLKVDGSLGQRHSRY